VLTKDILPDRQVTVSLQILWTKFETYATSKETSGIFDNPKVRYLVKWMPPLGPNVIKLTTVHTFLLWFASAVSSAISRISLMRMSYKATDV
jgi:hypothetical protein